jgi:hypothetical protein
VLTEEARNMIHKALIDYDEVFGTSLDGYNGKAGPFQAHLKMCRSPTTTKERESTSILAQSTGGASVLIQ